MKPGGMLIKREDFTDVQSKHYSFIKATYVKTFHKKWSMEHFELFMPTRNSTDIGNFDWHIRKFWKSDWNFSKVETSIEKVISLHKSLIGYIVCLFEEYAKKAMYNETMTMRQYRK